jgi:hypothetical protein
MSFGFKGLRRALLRGVRRAGLQSRQTLMQVCPKYCLLPLETASPSVLTSPHMKTEASIMISHAVFSQRIGHTSYSKTARGNAEIREENLQIATCAT